MHSIRSLVFRSLPVLAASMLLATGTARAQSTELLKKLNAPAGRVAEKSKSATRLFTAYLDMTKPPQEVGEDFNQTNIWPGMEDWAAVSKWAEANGNMGKALVESEGCQILGVPYGTAGVDPKFVERGLVAEIGVGGDLSKVRFPYLDALETISAYVAADMYRLCEAGSFEPAFKLGIAHLRVLRQACDAQMFEEKLSAMGMLANAFSVHRDLLFVYGGKMTPEYLRTLATKEYPFLKASDNERLKRIEMPEGDLLVAEELMKSVFSSDGVVSDEKFAKTFSGLQSAAAPLTTFGANKRWAKIAGVHGSLDASSKKLNAIYDDWWRRWRLPQYGPMIALPTVYSKTNPVKYAAVVLAVRDIDQLFGMRRRLVAEFGGTVASAGIAAYRRELGQWPDDIKKAYTQFFPKRFNFDPYDIEGGQFFFETVTRERGVDSEFGRVDITGCVLYARNDDHQGNSAARHAEGGKADDFVLWPSLRAISRGQAK